MAYVTKTFDNLEELADYLNDIVLSSPMAAGSKIFGLHGKTLIINDGGADRTATFVDADGTGLLPKEVLNQIHAAHASLLPPNVGFRNYGHAAPPKLSIAVFTTGYIVKTGGTANALLGFSTTTAKTVGANAVVKTDIVSINRADEGNRISVLHE